MKNIKFILVALVAIFITLGSTSVYAQEDGNRDKNGYVVKGPYLTNGGGSNWFINLGGGATTFLGTDVDGFKVAPAVELTAGKWFTPTVGAQFGYSGFQNRIDKTLNVPAFGDVNGVYGFHYVHGDFLWNFSNAVSGYKETRFWDVIPYATAGVLVNVSENAAGERGYAHEIAGGFGIINDFRLSNTVDLYLKVGALASQQRRMVAGTSGPGWSPTATVGITINLGKKKNFDRYLSVVPVPVVYPFTEQEYRMLLNENRMLREFNTQLQESLTDCQNAHKDTIIVKETVVKPAPLGLYFEIGKFDVFADKFAEENLHDFAETILTHCKGAEIVITGCADSATGSYKRNLELASLRADHVRELLENYGIDPKQIMIKVAEPGSLSDSIELNRVAIVE